MDIVTEKIALGAGCFWGVQNILDQIPGVLSTRCGYMGGNTVNPSYKEVCRGDTDHAEVVEVEYDIQKLSLKELLDYFWRLHDPTQLNRQGVDIGTQYRSAIFYQTEAQKEVALQSKNWFNGTHVFNKPAVTEILPYTEFYEAEDYHQKYFDKNGGHVCHILRPV